MTRLRAVEFEEYAKWFATPTLDRLYRDPEGNPVHLKNKKDFAAHFGLDVSTLFHWEQDSDFKAKTAEYNLEYIKDGLSGVLRALRENAELKKDPRSIELYLKYVDKWFDQKEEVKEMQDPDQLFDSSEFLSFFALKLSERPELEPTGLNANQLLKIIREVLGK